MGRDASSSPLIRIGEEALSLKPRLQEFSDGALHKTKRAISRKRSDNDQKALELQKVIEDYMRLAVELLRWRHKHQEGERTLHYRADEETKLPHIYDGQWREAYQMIGGNLVKLKEQTLHSAKHEVRGFRY